MGRIAEVLPERLWKGRRAQNLRVTKYRLSPGPGKLGVGAREEIPYSGFSRLEDHEKF